MALTSWRDFLGKKKQVKSTTPPKREDNLKTLCMVFNDADLVRDEGRNDLDISGWVETYKEKAKNPLEKKSTEIQTKRACTDHAAAQ